MKDNKVNPTEEYKEPALLSLKNLEGLEKPSFKVDSSKVECNSNAGSDEQQFSERGDDFDCFDFDT